MGKQWSKVDKQTGADKFIFYTSTSGIWQSVWLEPVPMQSVDKIVVIPDLDQNRVALKVVTLGEDSAEVVVLDGAEPIARKTIAT